MNTIQNRFVSAIDSGKITDHGDGLVTFNNGLVINSGEPMRDGLRYDIDSLDVSGYNRKVFASHEYKKLKSLLGTFTSIVKKGGRLIAEGMQYSMANPQGRLAYEMTLEGHLDEVSVGTLGFPPTEEGVYENHEVFETSFVLVPNDPSAAINSPLMRAVANGMDVSAFTEVKENTKTTKENTIKPKEEETKMAEEVKKVEEKEVATSNADVDALKEQVAALSGLVKESIEAQTETSKVVAENSAKWVSTNETTKEVSKNDVTEEIKNMHPGDRLREQIKITSSRRVTTEQAERLEAINSLHAEEIQTSDKIEDAFKSGFVQNNVHTTTDELTGIVMPASVIEGMYDVQTAYDGILNAFPYEATTSVLFESKILAEKMSYAWLAQKEEDAANTGANGNLKPLTGTQIKKKVMQMDEYAGVIIVSDYALKSGAVNLVNEVARQSREADARILANLTIGTIETAVETRVAGTTIDGYVFAPDLDGSVAFAASGDTEKQKAQSLVDYVQANGGNLVNGIMVMSKHSSGTLRVQLGLTANQALDRGEIGEDPVLSRIFGHTVITTPNELMPRINSGATTTVGTPGGNVTVDHAVYFLERDNWDGKQFLGGAQFDSSDTAAYEIGGNTRSAFMRDETVIRGYGYAAAQVKDFRYVTGLQANA